MQSEPIVGFIRTTYDVENKRKYTSYYPRGWSEGDLREPVIQIEPYDPAPPRIPVNENGPFYERPQPPVGDLPPRIPRVPLAPSAANGDDDAAILPWAQSLKAYLEKAWLPKYTLEPGVNTSVRHEWPSIPSLSRPAGTRTLVDIGRIDECQLSKTVALWKDGKPDLWLTPALAEEGKLVDLTLPDVTHCVMGEDDFRLLASCRLRLPSDTTRLLIAYPIRTVLKVLKFFLDVPEDSEDSTRLRFHDVNHLCPIQDVSLFDLIALPGRTETDISLLMVVVSPWDIRFDDLEKFVRVGNRDDIRFDDLEKFVRVGNRDGDFDLTSNKPPSPSDVLWAVIWDICTARNCRFFVLTNYDSWVFGKLSLDMKRAELSTHLPAPVFPPGMIVRASDVCSVRLPVPNVFECLLFWLVAAMGYAPDFRLPPDVEVPEAPALRRSQRLRRS